MAEYPAPARRPATDRTQSFSPLFSWMTSTAPLELAAWAHAACSWLLGPGQVIGWVGSALAIPGGCGGLSWRCRAASAKGVEASSDCLAAGRDERGRGRRRQTEQAKPSHRFASGEQTVDVIGRDLLGEVAL